MRQEYFEANSSTLAKGKISGNEGGLGTALEVLNNRIDDFLPANR